MTPFDTICYLRTSSSISTMRAGDVGARVGNISSRWALKCSIMECDETFWVNSYTNISLLYDSLSLIQEQKKNITLCYLFTKKLTHYYEILLLSNFHTKKWCEILSQLKKICRISIWSFVQIWECWSSLVENWLNENVGRMLYNLMRNFGYTINNNFLCFLPTVIVVILFAFHEFDMLY